MDLLNIPLTMLDWMRKHLESQRSLLPENLDIGKRVRIKSGFWKDHTGTIKYHNICGDDCAGAFGKICYTIKNEKIDKRANSSYDFYFAIDDCEWEFID